MKSRHAAACAHCGSIGKQRQIDELLRFNKGEPVIVLCNQSLHLLKYADASTWKWFREYRDRSISSQVNLRHADVLSADRLSTPVEC
jgi:hypothetical protein